MNEKPEKRKVISIIYMICAVVCAVRGALNLYVGNLPVGMVQIIFAAIFITAYSFYKNPPKRDDR